MFCIRGSDNQLSCIHRDAHPAPLFSLAPLTNTNHSSTPPPHPQPQKTVGCLLSAVCFAIAARRLWETRASSSSSPPSGGQVSPACSPRGGGGGGGVGGGTAATSLGSYTRPRILRLALSAAVMWSTSIFAFHVSAWKTRCE